MLRRAACLCLAMVLTTGWLAAAQEERGRAKSQAPDETTQEQDAEQLAARIAALVRELDADEFQTREKAQQALLEIGTPALEAVRAAAKSPSAEVRFRARDILEKLESQASGIQLVESHQRPELAFVTSAECSSDGRFVYAAAWQPGTVSIFARDPKTGRLQRTQSFAGANMQGAVSIRLSPDERLAAAPAFRSNAVVLFERSERSGRIQQLDIAQDGQNDVAGLTWPIELAWSPDSKFLYVAAARAETDGGIAAFRVDDGKLKFVELNTGRDACFKDARGLVVHPGGKTIYVASSNADTLVVLGRDGESGKTEVRQVLKDGENGVSAIAGACSVALDREGKHLYVSSGRFKGDDAISAFAIAEDGSVELLQEIVNGKDGLRDFQGGNEILVSRDGKQVFAVGTRSRTLARFDRDPTTGKLSSPLTMKVGTNFVELGAAGLGTSPDGRFLYLALEGDGAIGVYNLAEAAATAPAAGSDR
ncbi:MAG: lactonase family protein [Planctomycetes bacterium]|nr:lactonase family protein [Planctomycetota bacterium]